MFDKQIRQEKKEFQHVIQPQEVLLLKLLRNLDFHLNPKNFHSFVHTFRQNETFLIFFWIVLVIAKNRNKE